MPVTPPQWLINDVTGNGDQPGTKTLGNEIFGIGQPAASSTATTPAASSDFSWPSWLTTPLSAGVNAATDAGLPGVSTAVGVGNAVTGALTFASILADIPRLTTMLLGLILIIAGVFALSRGPVVQVVGGAIKEAVTS